jgi:two-component system capsular synthesis sensor histidine kinase RcsC
MVVLGTFLGIFSLLIASAIILFRLRKKIRDAEGAVANTAREKQDLLQALNDTIRNPIQAIQGHAEILRRKPDPSTSGESSNATVDTLLHAVDQLTMSATNLLGYFNALEEPVNNQNEMIDLPETVEDVCRSWLLVAKEKDIEFFVNIQDGAPHRIDGASRQIKQIIASLISASLALAPRGGSIEITVHRFDVTNNSPVRISISDSGPALSPQAIEVLFRPYGLDGIANHHLPSSVGLQPHMAHEFARRIGARVDYSVNLGAGSFSFEFFANVLNTVNANDKPHDVIHAFRDYFARHRAQLTPKRVLLAEDHVSNQNMITATLESAGHSVTIAATGNAALHALDEDDFDVILLDLGLPGLGGVDILKLVQLTLNARTPCIVISGDASPESRSRANAPGVSAFLTKPVPPQALLDTFVHVVRRGRVKVKSPKGGSSSLYLNKEQVQEGGIPRNLTMAMRDCMIYLSEMQQAASRHQWGEVQQLARAIRGTAQIIGALQVVNTCGLIVNASSNELPRRWTAWQQQLVPSIDDARETLMALSHQHERASNLP